MNSGSFKTEAAFGKMAKAEIEKAEWLPSNGTSGEAFYEDWCYECLKCPIDPGAKNQCSYMRTAAIGDHNGQWYTDESGKPFCNAFKSRVGHNRERARKRRADDRQQDLFQGES